MIIRYCLPKRSMLNSLATTVNTINDQSGGGGGGSIEKGSAILQTYSEIYPSYSYTGSIDFDSSFTNEPIVTCSSSDGNVNITDVTPTNFSVKVSLPYYPSSFTSVPGTYQYYQPRLCEVNEHPAFVVKGQITTNIVFFRALDPDGSSWPSSQIEVTTDASYLSDQRPGVNIVNNFPVVSYYSDNNLKYISALDQNGETWGSSMVVDSTLISQTSDISHIILLDGKPVILYFDAGYSIRYAYSKVPIPTSSSDWETMSVIDINISSLNYWSPIILVVDGKPAIVYTINTGIYYIRSLVSFPTSPSDWSAPVQVYNQGVNSLSVETINNKPYILTWKNNLIRLFSSDDNGENWTSVSIIPYSPPDPATQYFLKVINGIPRIVYTDSSNNYILTTITSMNSEGTAWFPPLVSSIDYRCDYFIQVLDINGLAVSFYDTNTSRVIYMNDLQKNVKLYYIAVEP